MPNFMKTIIVGVLAVTLVVAGFALGIQVGERAYDENFQAIQQAWDIINRDYVEQDKVDPAQLSQAAIQAMMDVLGDPYSAYLNPDMYRMEIDDSSGQFEDIGAEVSEREGMVTIIAPYPGSPAETTGIRAGDIILEVDGVPVTVVLGSTSVTSRFTSSVTWRFSLTWGLTDKIRPMSCCWMNPMPSWKSSGSVRFINCWSMWPEKMITRSSLPAILRYF